MFPNALKREIVVLLVAKALLLTVLYFTVFLDAPSYPSRDACSGLRAHLVEDRTF